MWQEYLTYGVLVIVVCVVIYRQIRRFKKPEQSTCGDAACAGCALKEHCNNQKKKESIEDKNHVDTDNDGTTSVSE